MEDAESFDDPDAAEGEEGDDPDDPAKEQGIDSWRYSLVTAQRAFNLSRPRGVTLGGYGQHEFLARDGEDPQFRAHRYVLFIYGQISDRIQTSTELEFEFAGSPLKRDGTLGPGEVLLEFSVIDFTLFDWLVLRAGVILMPTASFNLLHDAPTRDLVDRPIAYTTIVPSTWFESGAGILGEFEIGDVTTGYELYVVNGLDARISDGFGLRAARGSHFEDNNTDKAITGRVYLSPTMGLHMGLAGYTGEYDKRGNRINMLNADFRFRALPFEFLGEAVLVQIDPGFVEGFSESSAANTRDAVPEGMRGFYLQANYHFTIGPLWDLLPADLKGATFTTALRYEAMNTDTRRTSAAGDGTRLTWGINFRPIEQLVFKCDFQWNARGSETASAAHLWQRNFWRNRTGGFLFDSLAASAAYLF